MFTVIWGERNIIYKFVSFLIQGYFTVSKIKSGLNMCYYSMCNSVLNSHGNYINV